MRFFSVLIVLMAASMIHALEPVVIQGSINSKSCIYKQGDKIEFTLKLTQQQSLAHFMKCELYKNGKLKQEKIVSADETGKFIVKAENPGWIAVIGIALDRKKAAKKVHPKNPWDKIMRAGIGVMVEPLKIKLPVKCPEDFDQFWKQQRLNLDKIPLKVNLKEVEIPEKYRKRTRCYDVQIDCQGYKPVSAYMCIPQHAKKKSLPLVVLCHGAGVRSSSNPAWRRGNAIYFDFNAHGIPNGHNKEYYHHLSKTMLRGYSHRGSTDRNLYYFKNMFIRVMRALDYVKTIQEWDGRNLIVMGNSMGGGQALVAASLDKDVSLCIAEIPGLGDQSAELAGRLPAYPKPFKLKNGQPDNPKVAATVGYFDTANFAARIKCPVYLSAGLIDFTCPPTAAYTIYNALPLDTVKNIRLYPESGHIGSCISNGRDLLQKLVRKKKSSI